MIHKNILYHSQQIDIVNKIITILELDNYNSITLYELDNNINKQNQILNLLPDIKKYFSLSFVKGVQNPDSLKRPWLSIIKQILKDDFSIISSDFRFNINNEKIRTKKYFFIKKNSI